MYPIMTEDERRRQAEILAPALAPGAGAAPASLPGPGGFHASQSPGSQALMPAMAPGSNFQPLATSPARPPAPAAKPSVAPAAMSGAGSALMQSAQNLNAMQPRPPVRMGVSPGGPMPMGPAPLAPGSLRRPSGRPMVMSDRGVKTGISTGNAAVEAVLNRLASRDGAR